VRRGQRRVGGRGRGRGAEAGRGNYKIIGH